MNRIVPLLIAPLLLFAAPASAQVFYKPPVIDGGALLAPEPGYGQTLTGATAAENKAAIVWGLRSALNVAALQCNDPLLRIPETYNVMLTNHRDELGAAFASLTSYFKRKNKTVKAGQNALDAYGTRTYSSFSAVSGIQPFCHIAGKTLREAIFAPRGKLGLVAENRLRQLHNAVKSRAGEQQFTRPYVSGPWRFPKLDEKCWKKGKYVMECGLDYRS